LDGRFSRLDPEPSLSRQPTTAPVMEVVHHHGVEVTPTQEFGDPENSIWVPRGSHLHAFEERDGRIRISDPEITPHWQVALGLGKEKGGWVNHFSPSGQPVVSVGKPKKSVKKNDTPPEKRSVPFHPFDPWHKYRDAATWTEQVSAEDPPQLRGIGAHYTFARGRMGFMIVFDVNSRESFEEAKHVYHILDAEVQKEQQSSKRMVHNGGGAFYQPVVFLLAAQMDVYTSATRTGEMDRFAAKQHMQEREAIINEATLFAKAMTIMFFKVSAALRLGSPECDGVGDCFHKMIHSIRTREALWQFKYPPKATLDPSDKDDSNCVAQ